MEVQRSLDGYIVTQCKQIIDLIKLANLTDGEQVDTPLELNVKYSKDGGDALSDPPLHGQIMRSFIYLTMTNPDIAHAVQVVSQFVSYTRKTHLSAVHSIIKILTGHQYQRVVLLLRLPLCIQAFANAGWAGCLDRRSTTR